MRTIHCALLLLLTASGLTAQTSGLETVNRLANERRFAEAALELQRFAASGAPADEALLRKVAETTRYYLNGRLGNENRKAARLLLCSARSQSSDKMPPQEEWPDPVRVGGAVQRPRLISQVDPVYPEEARREKIAGTVIVESIIDQEGCVINVRALKGLPKGLTEAAIQAVQRWVFEPATLEDRPVKVYYLLHVNFQVQDEPAEPAETSPVKEI